MGPLSGVRIVEFAGIGPGPYCGMLLSDMGAEIIRIDRLRSTLPPPGSVTLRGRSSLALDLKAPQSRDLCLDILASADAMFEGFRPGVMERLGLGPDEATRANPRLVYGRMTGWGQHGPLAPAAGHDINYIALSGALHAIGPAERPVPPLNLVGDFGGGALFLALGMLAALLHARATGKGQVVDAAMSDGAASLMAMFYGKFGAGAWTDRREANYIDGGSHFYRTYQCSDGEWIAIAAIEPQFYAELIERAGLRLPEQHGQMDVEQWPALQQIFEARFRERTRAEWTAVLEGTDACFAPVLSLGDAPSHPHNAARKTFVELDGIMQPSPAPRFSLTPSTIQTAALDVGQRLENWGCSSATIRALRRPAV